MYEEIDKKEILERIEASEEEIFENMKKCAICGEWYPEDYVHETIEMIKGGCGQCCEQCIQDGDMREC